MSVFWRFPLPKVLGSGRAFGSRFPIKPQEELLQMPQSLTEASSLRIIIKLFFRKTLRTLNYTQFSLEERLHLNFVTFQL